MDDVTLINPLTSRGWRLPPLGLLYVASYLEKHGVTVKIIDPMSEGEECYRSESRYTGITCMSSQFAKTKEVARRVKDTNPETTIVVGGVHPTVSTEEVLSDPNIDVAVVGEGEKAMLNIVSEGVKKGVVCGERIRNLDDIPFPARHLINMEWYLRRDSTVVSKWLRATYMITSRGCPFHCAFCINSKHEMFGNVVRYNSASYVESEVEELVSSYGIKGIYFADDAFTANKNRLTELCRRIRHFDLQWNCMSRVDSLNKPLLELMKESGCVSIGFGVESGSQKVLNALNKKARVEDAIRIFDLCRETGIKTWATVIVGNPEETADDLRLTDKLLDRLKPDSVGIYFLTPFQGTAIHDMAVENGWHVSKDADWFIEGPQMEINFTENELREIWRTLMKRHSHRLGFLRSYFMNPYFVLDLTRQVLTRPSSLLGWINGNEGLFQRD
jgi:radical SAM superfamily enzyme YgiQ (UPF0313 family)